VTKTIAVTGATGFVGSTLIKAAADQGLNVRALTRRPQPDMAGVIWVEGALDKPESLARLVEGSDAVIHVAGVVNAPTREGFELGNIRGTQAIIAAAKAAGVARFVHVSSLAAREPGLSVYGWSKAGAEDAVRASGLDWAMVRPPAIYGPGDMEMLDIFKMAKTGVMLMPPAGHLSVIHAGDLVQLLLALTAANAPVGKTYEVDDGQPGGWTHAGFAKAIADAMSRRALVLSTPHAVLKIGSVLDRLLRGDKAKLTADRVNYFCHPDWRVDASARPDEALWTPQIETRRGLRETADWYRATGLV
jgi:nucleoside-diphosphate-sugar epimerase